MSIKICCDFCGVMIEEVELKEAWSIEKFRGRERICCEDCERDWEKYREEFRTLEETCEKELAERKQALREKYSGLQKDSGEGLPRSPGQPKDETTEKKIPPTIFKTLRD